MHYVTSLNPDLIPDLCIFSGFITIAKDQVREIWSQRENEEDSRFGPIWAGVMRGMDARVMCKAELAQANWEPAKSQADRLSQS